VSSPIDHKEAQPHCGCNKVLKTFDFTLTSLKKNIPIGCEQMSPSSMLANMAVSICKEVSMDTLLPSQMELDAFNSMMTVALPFPPVPVMCLTVTDTTDAYASSHDVLGSAISSSLIGEDYTRRLDAGDIQKNKHSILMKLNHEVSDIWKQHIDQDLPLPILQDNVYKVYCDSFRCYMSCYPGCSDLRMMPIDSVDVGSRLHRQAVQHFNARAGTFSDSTDIGEAQPFHTYRQLLVLYSRDLHAEAQNPMCDSKPITT